MTTTRRSFLKTSALAVPVLAGLNAIFFEATLGARTMKLDAGDDTPRSAKIVGAVSLVSWLGVLYWGRMLPFIGNAF